MVHVRAGGEEVGREPDDDPERVSAAREAAGEDVRLFVDANGAYAADRLDSRSERWATSETPSPKDPKETEA